MSYSFYRQITVDHTKCGSTNTTDFPALFFGTYTYLKTSGNGGDIQNTVSVNGVTVPADLIFSTDNAGASPLKWQIVSYDATTGVIVAWIKIPTLSASVDTVIYMLYKNPAVTTWQGDITGTWNSSYLFNIHCSNSVTDSTSNARDFAVFVPSYTSGKFGTCLRTDGSDALTRPSRTDSGLPTGTNSRTIKMWVNFQTGSTGGYFAYGNQGTTDQDQRLRQDAPSFKYLASGDDIIYSFTPTTSQWYYLVCTFNSSGTVGKIYLDGSNVTTATKSAWNTVLAGSNGCTIGQDAFSAISIDVQEVAIRNVVESADEVLAGYNNQNNPGTFYAIGAAVPIGGSGVGGSNLGRIINIAVRLH